jgi:hypothetical protein
MEVNPMNANDAMTQINEDDYVIMIQTMHINTLQKISSLIKDILSDVPITITGDRLRIDSINKAQTGCVNIVLYGASLEKFVCNEPKVNICVNSIMLHKELAAVANKDILYLYIRKDNCRHGIYEFLTFDYFNERANQHTANNLTLINNNADEELGDIDVEDEYEAIIHMPSDSLSRMLHKIHSYKTETVELCVIGRELSLHYDRPCGSGKIVCVEKAGCMTVKREPAVGVIIKQTFSVHALYRMVHSAVFCPHVNMYMSNDMPILLKYAIGANLGEMKLSLRQK